MTHTFEQLQNMPDDELDAVVWVIVFGEETHSGKEDLISWSWMGEVVLKMKCRGWLLFVDEGGEVWFSYHDHTESEKVIDNDSLPRAVAIAAVLAVQEIGHGKEVV